MMRLLYRALTDISALPLAVWLRARARRGKEKAERLGERRGIASAERPPGRLAWIHAASVGESLSLLPVISGVRGAGWQVLMTTGTVTSAMLLAERLPAGSIIHQFAPLDRMQWVCRFLDHWRPDLALRADSELWPNTLMEIGARGIPLVQINARLSDRAFRGWRRWPSLARRVTAPLTLVLAQSREDGANFEALGARDVRALGNLKLAAAPLPADMGEVDLLRTDLRGRAVWLAASIHPGEEAIVAQVARAVKAEHRNTLTILVPRHPEKGRTMAEGMRGLKCALRSQTRRIPGDADVYIADTMGELGVFYRLSEIVFVGKSFAVGGGQNPAEPALLGCALMLGPDMSNFREIAAELVAAGAADQVSTPGALCEAVRRLLEDPERRRRMIAAGQAVMRRHASAANATMEALSPYLAGAEIR